MKAKRRFDELLYAEIRARRREGNVGRQDILNLFLETRLEDGTLLSDEHVRDEIMTLLVAGHDTIGTALAWAFHFTHANPRIRERLVGELETLGPDADPDAIAQLPYLGAVLQETLRLYPPVTETFRLLAKPMQVLGYELQPGQAICAAIALAHRQDAIYPEPLRFQPERFLARRFSPFEYLPFGGGVRRCIGMALALYEMKIVFASILSRGRLSLVDASPVVPTRRNAVVMGPKGGVPMVLDSRIRPAS